MSPYYEYKLNFRNSFLAAARNFPQREIVYRDKKRYTFSEFYDRVLRLCNGLRSIGVNEGDVVGVIDWDTYVYMESYFGVPMSGATLHTINIRYPPELIYLTMNFANDKYVIIRDEFVPIVEKNASLFDFVKGWIVYSESGNPVETKLSPKFEYEDLLKVGKCDPPDLDEQTRATIFFTSGTTGMPKGVTFTQKQLMLHALSLSASMKYRPLTLTEQDVFMSLVPMFHVHSWGMPYIAFINGNKYVLPGRYEVKTILELLKNEKVTFSTMVPSILYMILNDKAVEDYREYLKGWKVIIGGAALPKGLALKAISYGITVVGGYGLSETCPVLTVSIMNDYTSKMKYEEALDHLISAGLPIPLVNLRVVDPTGKDVPWDGKTVGEVIARAPWLTKEYYNDPEKTEELWKGDWLHTGDLGVIDEFGYLHIVDREKDAIKSGGEFIPTLILENAISEVKGVGEVAVVGVPDPKWGERPVAFVVKSGETSEKEIYEHLNDYVRLGRIQKWWIPDKIYFIESMPRTSTNKIDKKLLREKVGG
ncbi:MAG: long-chain-fatty-acid--CoA ligase [Nitrososphaeria archaeon]